MGLATRCAAASPCRGCSQGSARAPRRAGGVPKKRHRGSGLPLGPGTPSAGDQSVPWRGGGRWWSCAHPGLCWERGGDNKSSPSSSCPHDLKAQQAGVTAKPPPGDVSLQSWGRSHSAHTGGHSLEQGTPCPSRPPQQGLSWNRGGGRCALRSRGQHRSHELLQPCPPHAAPGTPGRAGQRGHAGSSGERAHPGRGAGGRRGKGRGRSQQAGGRLEACGEEFRIAASPSPSPQAQPAKFGLGTSAGTGGCGGAMPGG